MAAALTLVTPLAPRPAAGAPDADPDADLVSRARRGDRNAFAALFRRHHGRVVAMCTRLLREAGDVDDAVQQTFLEAWRCLHRFEGKSRFTTWLTRIAIHTSFSTRRRLKRLLASDLDDTDGPALAPAWGEGPLSADEVSARRAQEQALGRVLGKLSDKKRTVFVLSDLEGHSSTEIAEILEVPDATVRTRLFHARRELSALVAADPILAGILSRRHLAKEPVEPNAGGPR